MQEAIGSSLFSFFVPTFGFAIEMPPGSSTIANGTMSVILDFYITSRFKLYGYRTNAEANSGTTATTMQMPAMGDV